VSAAAGEKRIVVLGAGIVGICCALALRDNGFAVIVLDKDGPGEGTSFGAAGNLGGNAHFAIPGLVWKLPRMLLDPQHPLSLRWRDLPELIAWFRRYSSYAPAEHAARISKAGAALSAGVFDAYDTLLRDTGAKDIVTKRGRLFVWSTEAGWKKDQYGLQIRRQRGIHLDELSGDQVREIEPALGPIVLRGAYAPNAGHIVNPHRLVTTLAALLREKGGEIRRENVKDIDFAADDTPIVITEQNRHLADQVVLAAGVWSREFATRLGTRIPLVAERGYHAMLPQPDVTMKISTLWEERKVIFTPMEHGLRASGIAEFAVRDAPPRYALAERVIQEYTLEIELKGSFHLRPVICAPFEGGTSHIGGCGRAWRSYPQPRLVHQRQDRFAEELEIWRKVEERDLYPVASRPLEADQLVDHVFGAADDLDVAPEGAVLIAVRLPGDRVAAALMRHETFDRTVIGRIEDRRVVLLRFAVGLSADDHRVYDSAQLPAVLGPGGFNDVIMCGESGKRRIDLVPGGAGDENEVGMRRGVVDAGRGTRRIDQNWTPVSWLRRDEGLLEGPELAP
jgi:D-amino-acid dehydrogenase